jgi:hypothetical protein
VVKWVAKPTLMAEMPPSNHYSLFFLSFSFFGLNDVVKLIGAEFILNAMYSYPNFIGYEMAIGLHVIVYRKKI